MHRKSKANKHKGNKASSHEPRGHEEQLHDQTALDKEESVSISNPHNTTIPFDSAMSDASHDHQQQQPLSEKMDSESPTQEVEEEAHESKNQQQSQVSMEPKQDEPITEAPPQLSPEEFKRIQSRLGKIDEEIDKLERKLRSLPEQIAQYHSTIAALFWREKTLATSFASSPSQHNHVYFSSLAARTQRAQSTRLSGSQLTYTAGGISEIILQQIFKLDDIHGGGEVRFHRKSIVLRAKHLIRQADHQKARIPRCDAVLDKLDKLLATAAEAMSKRPAPAAAAVPPPLAQHADRSAPTPAQQHTPSKPHQAAPHLTSHADRSTPPHGHSPRQQEQQQQQHATEENIKSSISPAEAARKTRLAEFHRLKRSLPRASVEVDERTTADTVQILMNVQDIPQEWLFIDRDVENHQVSVSGVKFSSPQMVDSFGGFLGFAPQPRQPPVPSAWFEKIFEIPPSLSVEGLKVVDRDGILILSFPVIAEPHRRSPPMHPQHARQHRPAPRAFPGGFQDPFGSMFSRPFF